MVDLFRARLRAFALLVEDNGLSMDLGHGRRQLRLVRHRAQHEPAHVLPVAERAVVVRLEHRHLAPQALEDRLGAARIELTRPAEDVADDVDVHPANREPGLCDLHDLRIGDVAEDPVVEHPLDLLETDRGEGVGLLEGTLERPLRGAQLLERLGGEVQRQRVAAEPLGDQRAKLGSGDAQALEDRPGRGGIEIAERQHCVRIVLDEAPEVTAPGHDQPHPGKRLPELSHQVAHVLDRTRALDLHFLERVEDQHERCGIRVRKTSDPGRELVDQRIEVELRRLELEHARRQLEVRAGRADSSPENSRPTSTLAA